MKYVFNFFNNTNKAANQASRKEIFCSVTTKKSATWWLNLHAHQVLKNAFLNVIWNIETDGLVLATAAAARCDNKHLWVSVAVKESEKVLDILILKTAIGYQSLTLSIFLLFTGCDMYSSFKSIGKKTSW